jgi:hypothetical protein
MTRVSHGFFIGLIGMMFMLSGSCRVAAQWCTLYTENFQDGSIDDFDNGTYRVEWCTDGCTLQNVSPNYCDSTMLWSENSSEDPIIWVYLGNQGCSQIRLNYNYSQYPTSTGTVLEYKTSSDTTVDCGEYVYTDCNTLNVTGLYSCEPGSCVVDVNGVTSVYFEFDHGFTGAAIWLDDIEISLNGCDCSGSTSCLPFFNENFGTFFQSLSVCDIWPDVWESCDGNGPYISSMPPCGGPGDYAMALGQGLPYSGAQSVCVDLQSATDPTLQYDYSWDGFSSLSPEIVILYQVGSIWYESTLVASHADTAGACVHQCVDLSAYIGYDIKIRIESNYSGSTYHAYFDNVTIYPDDGPCPQDTPTPVPSSTVTPTATEVPSTATALPSDTPMPTATEVSSVTPTATGEVPATSTPSLPVPSMGAGGLGLVICLLSGLLLINGVKRRRR